jgi:hypothetical protein
MPREQTGVVHRHEPRDVLAGIATGNLRGRIEVSAADAATTAEIGGRHVRLELEPAALVYQ